MIQLNEVIDKLPPHLMQFVINQPYNAYTPVDQAVWRYVMRKNVSHLSKVAHASYLEGLKIAGIDIDNIPTMYGMNRILKKIGWAAVAVDGFIPPGAFMEFTAYKVLVIAADIRTIEHIEYTPAPDIIHESAGHAPIIADADFAKYLQYIGEVGSKVFSSNKDYELYEAIRHLSIIKEDPGTNDSEIAEGEKLIAEISANMGKPSEMALLRNLHWWTVEYGLIGTVENYKIYGAGLLSSIGESESCLKPEVKKIPYSIAAATCNYDITKPQPQLFVTPDFEHLTTVLNQFIETTAFKNGGLDAIQKAIASENTATCVFSSGLQVSGTFTEVLTDKKNNPIFLSTEGPTALAYNNKELTGHSKKNHGNGISSPIGKIKGCAKPLEDFSPEDLSSYDIVEGKTVSMLFESGIKIEGHLKSIIKSSQGKILLLRFLQCKIIYQSTILLETNDENYDMPVGYEIISAFAGPADMEAFQPVVNIPKEKTHKIVYNAKTLKLHAIYKLVRTCRETKANYYLLPKLAQITHNYFPKDWLISIEILEIFEEAGIYKESAKKIKTYLSAKKLASPELGKLIDDGLNLIYSKH